MRSNYLPKCRHNIRIITIAKPQNEKYQRTYANQGRIVRYGKALENMHGNPDKKFALRYYTPLSAAIRIRDDRLSRIAYCKIIRRSQSRTKL